jgi:hypothetical protein
MLHQLTAINILRRSPVRELYFFFLNNALYTLYVIQGFSSQKRKEVPASKLSTM